MANHAVYQNVFKLTGSVVRTSVITTLRLSSRSSANLSLKLNTERGRALINKLYIVVQYNIDIKYYRLTFYIATQGQLNIAFAYMYVHLLSLTIIR